MNENRYFDGVKGSKLMQREIELFAQAGHLAVGFQWQWDKMGGSDHFGIGFDGAILTIMESGFAHRCRDMSDALWIATKEDFCGVFVYEVTEEFGSWLCLHSSASDEDADNALVGLCAAFINNSEIGDLKAQAIAALVMKELQDGKDAETAGRRVLHRILAGEWQAEERSGGDSAPLDRVVRVAGSEDARANGEAAEASSARRCITCGQVEGNEACVTCAPAHV